MLDKPSAKVAASYCVTNRRRLFRDYFLTCKKTVS